MYTFLAVLVAVVCPVVATEEPRARQMFSTVRGLKKDTKERNSFSSTPPSMLPPAHPSDDNETEPFSYATEYIDDASNVSQHIIFAVRNESFPCEEYNESNPRGVYYINIPKTFGSAYWSGVIARNKMKLEESTNSTCYFTKEHQIANTLNLTNRTLDRSFLFAFIRKPRDFLTTNFFFSRVSKVGREPTGENLIKYSKRFRNFQSLYIQLEDSREAYELKYGAQTESDIAKCILSEYDFIGLVEKPYESLVLLQLLLGLDTEDILYNPSPLAGTISFFTDSNGLCQPVIESFVPPEAEAYFTCNEFYRDSAVDINLYSQVQKTMEATIDAVGRYRYYEALRLFRERMAVVVKDCVATVEYKCMAANQMRDVEKASCGRGGCEAACIESVIDKYSNYSL